MWNLENTPGRSCFINKKEFLFFSGYSYLGMNYVDAFCDHVKDGIDKYGIVFPSSRISNTRLGLYDEFEERLSKLTGLENTVTFSSGYLAGKTIAEILSSYKNIFVAPFTHPAINIATQNYAVNNFKDWQQQITTAINSSLEKEFVLIADAINIMESAVNDFSFLQNISSDKKIIFLIDDSHGIGILGKNGEGIIAQLPDLNNVEYVISYSLSKAFNVEGGAVSCSKKISAQLHQHPNYSGSTAIAPAFVHAFLMSENLYAAQREKLLENIQFLKNNLPGGLQKSDHNLPIFICRNENADEDLTKNGIIISSFGYPYPDSKKVNRIILNALHTKNDIGSLIKSAV